MERSNLLRGMEAAAREAGSIMLSANHIAESVTDKEGHANFVTKYDKLVQARLYDLLTALLPEARFIGEEDGKDRFTDRDRRGYAFCVDPIDGTSNFLTGYRPSVTSLALLREGKPYLGVVYNPYWGILCAGEAGQGAWVNGEPLRPSQSPLSRSLVSFGTSPYYPPLQGPTFALCQHYLPRCIDLRRSGSAAWDLCSVAMGRTGLYFELKLSLWDYAAGALIAQEAGCTLTDLRGNPLPWDGPSPVVCASPGVAKGDYLPPKELLPG